MRIELEAGTVVEGTVNRPPTGALLKERTKGAEAQVSVWHEVRALVQPMFRSRTARNILLLCGLVVIVLVLNVAGEIRMNRWQGDFFRAVEHRSLSEVGWQSWQFLVIMLVLLSFVVSQNWLLERFKIRLREWLTHSLLDEWMKPGHAYRLNMTSEEAMNPDQRIQEDVRNLSEMSGDLGIGAVRSSMLLISFVGILWQMSRGISLGIWGHSLNIPGYMVWVALIYAALGSWLAARVGSPLIKLNEERYTREANLRYSLVRISENAESISFYSGERDERKIVNDNLGRVLGTMKTLSFANARLTWIDSGHCSMIVILPVLVALPGYLQGKLDFGGLMMVVGAFSQVQMALRWFVASFSKIADWRAALHRYSAFRDAVLMVDEYEKTPEKILLSPHPEGILEFKKTGVSLMDGKIVISDATAKILPGERVLLVGESGTGKSTLLRAVGGLWPWGTGRILLPPREEMMFLPQKPYIPLGTLASAVAYPNAARGWDREEIKKCLIRANLEAFIPMLDETARWDKLMSLGQQQRLAFARLLLHRPKWVFLDEATSALDDENQHRVMSIFTEELAESALLSVGHRQGLEEYHNRKLHLVQDHEGATLRRKPRVTPEKRGRRGQFRLGGVWKRVAERV